MDYKTLADKAILEGTVAALRERNFEGEILATKEDALARIKELIPAGASIMNGASRTLEQIGFVELLQSKDHQWNNLHDRVLEEKDPAKQAVLRKQSVISDFYLGSVHALSQTGEMLWASNSGSQLPHIAFTSPNLILVVGAQKVVPNLAEGFTRLQEYVIPLEDERMKQVYGYGTMKAKTLVLHRENPAMGRKVRVLIVQEALGF